MFRDHFKSIPVPEEPLAADQLPALIDFENEYYEDSISPKPKALILDDIQNLTTKSVKKMLRERYGYQISKKRFYEESQLKPEVSKQDAYGSPIFHYLKREYRRLKIIKATKSHEEKDEIAEVTSIKVQGEQDKSSAPTKNGKKWKFKLEDMLSALNDLAQNIGAYMDDVFASLQAQGVLSSMAQVNEGLGGLNGGFGFLNVLFGIYEILAAFNEKINNTLRLEDQKNKKNTRFAKLLAAIAKVVLGLGSIVTAVLLATIALVTLPVAMFVFAVYQQITSLVDYVRNQYIEWKLACNVQGKKNDLKDFNEVLKQKLEPKKNDLKEEKAVDVPLEQTVDRKQINHKTAPPLSRQGCYEKLREMSEKKIACKESKREAELARWDTRFSEIGVVASMLGVVTTGVGLILSLLGLAAISVFAPWLPPLLLGIGVLATVFGLGGSILKFCDNVTGNRLTDGLSRIFPSLNVNDESKETNRYQSWARIKQMLDMIEPPPKLVVDEKQSVVEQDKIFRERSNSSGDRPKKEEQISEAKGNCEDQTKSLTPNLSQFGLLANTNAVPSAPDSITISNSETHANIKQRNQT